MQFVQAAQAALRMLSDARPPATQSLPPCEIIVFMAYTYGSTEETGHGTWQRLRDAGKVIRNQRVTFIAGCPYPDHPTTGSVCTTTKEIVDDQSHFAQNPDSLRQPMQRALADVEGKQSAGRVRGLSVTDLLPPNLSYIADSASEPPVVLPQPNGTLLRWNWDPVTSMEPHTVTYRTAPLAEGQHVITGTLRVEDQARGVSMVPMRPITLTVSGVCLPDTPTPSPTATATSTATPSPSLVATVIPSATTTSTLTPPPTLTPTPRPLLLPLLLKEDCTPGTQRTDVVLVLDASSSMLESTATGRSKLEAAVAAASTFLDQLHFDLGDQAAVVAFNSTATLLAPLTTDRGALNTALAGISTAQYTRLDLGIVTARTELAGPHHHVANTPVMIVLTDGRANPVPVSVAEAEVQLAKDAGVVVFTIGLGADLDTEALGRMASRPEYYYRAPDAEALAGIYRGIAVAIPCSASGFWGRR
jgi:hypothetical protein